MADAHRAASAQEVDALAAANRRGLAFRATSEMALEATAQGAAAEISERAYWEMNFPDRGDEERGGDPRVLVDRFEKIMLQAVEKR